MNKILDKISVKEAACLCGLSERTIRDWRREKFLPDEKSLRKLCKKVKIKFPRNIQLKDDYWYVVRSSALGAKAVIKKYGSVGGDPAYRKKRWYEWWEEKGKFQNNPIFFAKPIKKPKYSSQLAEFVGIVLGDGGMSLNQLKITLNLKDDKEYSEFVSNLIKKLFDVPVSGYYTEKYSVVNLCVSRRELIRFCTKKLGLKTGNKVKQQVDAPDWIKKNEKFSIACARGLIDTDGSIFNHRYKVSGKIYNYKKLSFTNRSQPLVQFIFNVFKRNNLNPRLSRGTEVWLDSKKSVMQYLKVFNVSNPKHLKRCKD